MSLAVEALALGALILAFFTVLGLGVTTWLLPGTRHLLVAPAVGLALLALGFQWLTFVVPPFIPAIAAFIALAPLTALMGWRRRGALLLHWPDVIGAGSIAVIYFLALLQIVIQRGILTLGSFPADNVFIYVQAAQYLRDHPIPSSAQAAAVANPGSFYLTTIGPSFPNSVGAIDAAASVLAGLPVYVVFDPISALALAMTAGPVWYFVRENLGGSWWAAAAAAALLATNQLLFWVIGVGLQQECLALPIFATGLCLVPVALRSGSLKAGALAGILGAALAGLYLPIAALLAVCALGCVLVRLLTEPAKWKMLVTPIGGAVTVGGAGSLAAAYVLLFHGGLSIWLSVVGSRVAAGAISKFPQVTYVIGTLPFAHVWELFPLPLGHTETLAWPLIFAASFLLIGLVFLGFARAVIQQHAAEAALLGAGLLFVAYQFAVAQYAYGFVKSVGYMAPLASVFAAFGAVGIGSLLRSPLSPATGAATSREADLPGFGPSGPAGHLPINGEGWRRIVELVGAVAMGIVLLASANAGRDMLRLWVMSPPALPPPYLQIADVASNVPVGTSVFIDSPTGDYGTLVQVAAMAYFLPDRNVRIYVGDVRLGTFQNQNVRPQACAFDYVISHQEPPSFSSPIYSDPVSTLSLYKRLGPSCGTSSQT